MLAYADGALLDFLRVWQGDVIARAAAAAWASTLRPRRFRAEQAGKVLQPEEAGSWVTHAIRRLPGSQPQRRDRAGGPTHVAITS